MRFDPATYPGPRPAGPVIVRHDRVRPLVSGPEGSDLLATALAAAPWRFSVAYGSNACPARLMDKGLTARGALLLPAVLRGWVPAFEDRVTGYGAVPLTLVPEPGAVTRTWVLGLPPSELATLDRSEGRVPHGAPAVVDRTAEDAHRAAPGSYQLGRVGEVEVVGRRRLPDGLAYLPGPATRVQLAAGRWRSWPEHDQASARRHVEWQGPAAPSPAHREVIVGGWPSTPLQPPEG